MGQSPEIQKRDRESGAGPTLNRACPQRFRSFGINVNLTTNRPEKLDSFFRLGEPIGVSHRVQLTRISCRVVVLDVTRGLTPPGSPNIIYCIKTKQFSTYL
jgi:hypothetical protein